PDIAFVFGGSWIKNPLLSYLNSIPSYNIHMGIAPLYRGHSTNFWAFWSGEPEYVGATILGLHQELDAGDIIGHVRPTLQSGDDYYSFSMRAAEDAIEACALILKHANSGALPKRHRVAPPNVEKYFKSMDFNDDVARKFLDHHVAMMHEYSASGR